MHVNYTICLNLLASVAEAKNGAVFINTQTEVPLRLSLEELGHPQPSSPIQVDNKCASGILNNTVKQSRSKSIDMRFYWVKGRIKIDELIIFGNRDLEIWLIIFLSISHLLIIE